VLSCETRDAARRHLKANHGPPLASLCNAHTAGENPDFPPLSSHVSSQMFRAMSQPSFPRSREFAIRSLKAMASFMFAHCSTSRYRWVQIIGIGLWAYQCRASLRFTARVGPTQLFPPSQPQARSLEPLLDVVTYFI
jgi:hypothetical protein